MSQRHAKPTLHVGLKVLRKLISAGKTIALFRAMRFVQRPTIVTAEAKVIPPIADRYDETVEG